MLFEQNQNGIRGLQVVELCVRIPSRPPPPKSTLHGCRRPRPSKNAGGMPARCCKLGLPKRAPTRASNEHSRRAHTSTAFASYRPNPYSTSIMSQTDTLLPMALACFAVASNCAMFALLAQLPVSSILGRVSRPNCTEDNTCRSEWCNAGMCIGRCPWVHKPVQL